MKRHSFWTILTHWWWAILLFALAITYGAFLYLKNSPLYYLTSTKLFVSQGINSALVNTYDISSADRSVRTVSVLLTNGSVINDISKKTNVPIANVKDNLEIKTIPSTQIIGVYFKDQDPNMAFKVLQQLPLSLQDLLDDLQGSTDEKSRIGISIAEAPILPTEPLAQRTTLLLGLAFCLSALGFYSLIFLLEYLDTTIKDINDLKAIGLEMLGSFGILKQTKNPLAITEKANQTVAEMLREVRTNISFLDDKKNIKSVVVTSSNPREGKSIFISNLSILLAESGKKIVLIDADLRSPFVHRIFKKENTIGLSDFIMGKYDGGKLITDSGLENLSLITAGTRIANPSELLNNKVKLEELKKFLYEEYKADYILFDAPPVGWITDAAIISEITDGVILIAEKEKTKIEDLERVKNTLEKLQSNILGVVLTKVKDNRKIYYYSERR